VLCVDGLNYESEGIVLHKEIIHREEEDPVGLAAGVLNPKRYVASEGSLS
jgi:hypothetical protein